MPWFCGAIKTLVGLLNSGMGLRWDCLFGWPMGWEYIWNLMIRCRQMFFCKLLVSRSLWLTVFTFSSSYRAAIQGDPYSVSEPSVHQRAHWTALWGGRPPPPPRWPPGRDLVLLCKHTWRSISEENHYSLCEWARSSDCKQWVPAEAGQWGHSSDQERV